MSEPQRQPESFVPIHVAGAGSATPEHVVEFRHTLFTLTPRLWVTPTIVAANVIVFLVMLASGVHWMTPTVASLVRWGANSGPQTAGGEWWRLATSMFIHIGVIHILFNMLVLWDVGQVVERLVGNVGFLITYLVSGLVGSLASLWWNPWVVSAGASGAVFGAYGALLGFVAFRHDAVPAVVRNRLLKSGAAFLAYNVIFGLSVKNIDLAAHGGGLAAGFVCGLVQSQRLSPQAAAGRRLRNLLVLVLGSLLVAAGAYGFLAVRGRPVDVEGEWDAYVNVEQQVLERLNEAVEEVNAGRLTEGQFADVLETEVLPPWRSMRQRMEALRGVPRADQHRLSRLMEYMALRQESWESRIEAVRDDDPQAAARAVEKQDAADALAREPDADAD